MRKVIGVLSHPVFFEHSFEKCFRKMNLEFEYHILNFPVIHGFSHKVLRVIINDISLKY